MRSPLNLLALEKIWNVHDFDSWPNLTIGPFVSFLLFTVSSTLSGSKQQQPILTLGPF